MHGNLFSNPDVPASTNEADQPTISDPTGTTASPAEGSSTDNSSTNSTADTESSSIGTSVTDIRSSGSSTPFLLSTPSTAMGSTSASEPGSGSHP